MYKKIYPEQFTVLKKVTSVALTDKFSEIFDYLFQLDVVDSQY